METIESFYFNRLAYVQSKVSNDVLKELKNEAKFILENQNKFLKYNNELAGNLEKEYSTKILSIPLLAHDASVCTLKDDKIISYQMKVKVDNIFL